MRRQRFGLRRRMIVICVDCCGLIASSPLDAVLAALIAAIRSVSGRRRGRSLKHWIVGSCERPIQFSQFLIINCAPLIFALMLALIGTGLKSAHPSQVRSCAQLLL